MKNTVSTYRLGLIGVLAMALVGATAPPNTGSTTVVHPTPTPKPTPVSELKLSDTIQFDGKFCQLTSDAGDHDAGAKEKPGPVHCSITIGPAKAVVQITVPGDPSETINFHYSIAANGTLTGSGTEVEKPGTQPYPATITGTAHGVIGSSTGSGIIKVWEASTAP